MSATSIAMTVTELYIAARLIAPERDWNWLKALKQRLHARAEPLDRFQRLVPAHQTLDLGITLMETADHLPASGTLEREIQFRDGLIVAILSLWPIRRRSLAALTLDCHVRRVGDQIELLLFPEDTKAKRADSWPMPELLLPFMIRYLDRVRPRLARVRSHDALWVGQHGYPLGGGGLYNVLSRRTAMAFGDPMSPHDFRRAAATFLAMENPDKVGLTPGVLQHTSPETGSRYYNLSRSMSASRRHSTTLSDIKARLRPSAR
jgi:integrase